MSAPWIICPKCGVGQSARAEGSCARCGADTSAAVADANRPYTPMSTLNAGQQGSLGLGVALGAIFGLWGLIGVMIFGQDDTKKGAAYGYGGRLVVTLVIVLAVLSN